MTLILVPLFVGDALMAHANGGCYRCGRGDNLVDLDAQIEGEGALVLCTGCITDAAEAASLTFNDARVRELEGALATALSAQDTSAAEFRDRIREALGDAPKKTRRG